MADEELEIVENRSDFYRDRFGKVLFIIIGILIALGLLASLSIYLHLQKPQPTIFKTGNEYRVVDPVPIDQPYLSSPDLLQWVSNALNNIFIFDFINYNDQIKAAQKYFTDNGWNVFSNHLNTYANSTTVQNSRLFVNATPAGAPIIINQGPLSGRYAWVVQMPLTVSYAGYTPPADQSLTMQVLVVRVPTVDNLDGVAIDNVTIINTRLEGGAV